jgi:2-aminomuconate deaminase
MSEIINTAKAPEPVGAYPHARIANGFVFLSGVGPRQPGTKVIPGVDPHDIKVQTEAVIENVKIILKEAGSSFDKIIDVQVFLTDMDRDFKAYNEVYAKHFTKIQATRTTIAITALPTPIAVEFKVIALAE